MLTLLKKKKKHHPHKRHFVFLFISHRGTSIESQTFKSVYFILGWVQITYVVTLNNITPINIF